MNNLIFYIGFAILLSGGIYRVIFHPEWTESQSLINLWWVYLLGCVMCFGELFFRSNKIRPLLTEEEKKEISKEIIEIYKDKQ